MILYWYNKIIIIMLKRHFITLFIIAFSLQLSMSKDLFKVYYPSNEAYNLIIQSYPEIDMSLIQDSILFLQLNHDELEYILRRDVSFLQIFFPFFNQNNFNLELEEFKVTPENLFVTRHTNKGIVKTLHTSNIKSYRIINNDYMDVVEQNKKIFSKQISIIYQKKLKKK